MQEATSSSTLRLKVQHRHQTSSGALIAIERSVGPKGSPKQGADVSSNRALYEMLTAEPLELEMQRQTQSGDNGRPTPHRPLLPPRILKLDSPSCTVHSALSTASSTRTNRKDRDRHRARVRRDRVASMPPPTLFTIIFCHSYVVLIRFLRKSFTSRFDPVFKSLTNYVSSRF